MIQVFGVWSLPTGPLSARLAGYSVGPPSRTVAEEQAWLGVVDVGVTVAVDASETRPRRAESSSSSGATPSMLLVDDQDAHLLSERVWRKGGGRRLYWIANVDGKTVYLHRVILNAPEGLDVDHINGDPDDNRRCNLRLASRSQNLAKKATSPGPSGYRGVWWSGHRSCWRAGLRINKKTKHLGYFDTREEAAAAYNKAAASQWGEFAILNTRRGCPVMSLPGAPSPSEKP